MVIKNKYIENPPVGIIKTMPMSFFNEYPGGEKIFIKHLLNLNYSDEKYFIFNLSGRPKYEILYFYLLYSGAIQFRMNVIGYEIPENGIIILNDGRILRGRIFIQVAQPVIRAIDKIQMKGFQGFRYSEFLF